MITTIIILIAMFLIEFFFSPRLDFTREKKCLLYYYGKNRCRNYIVLF